MTDRTWLDAISAANSEFVAGITPAALPAQRVPGSHGLITCMDPRVDLRALGVHPSAPDGSLRSTVRVLRSVGGRADERSLVVGVHMAGIREWAVVTHTDCGAALAWQNVGVLAERLEATMGADALRGWAGDSTDQGLRDRLLLFADPREAARAEVARIRTMPSLPDDLVVHGLCYDVATGKVEVVVDGTAGG